jgi:hypothetical protein
MSFLLFQLSVEAKIYGPKRYDSAGLETYISSEAYYTNSNFDSNSNESHLTGSNYYMLVDIPVGIRYPITPIWDFEAELTGSWAKSKSSDPTFGGERTNSQIHEMRLSTDTLMPMDGFDLIPELEAIFPFGTISGTTDSVMIGEQVTSFTGKLNLQTRFSQTDLFSYLGYQKRGSGRSDLLPWSVGLGWNAGVNMLGLRVFGFQSATQDSDKSNELTREATNYKVNGGSLKFYAVDPAVTSIEALWFLKFPRQWQLQFNAGLDLAGTNYSKGQFAGLTLIFDWGDRGFRGHSSKKVVQPRGSGFAVDSDTVDFKEDTNEGNDQQYFAPPPPPRVRPAPAPRPKPKTNVGPTDQQLQDQMDDTEMQIELKRKKSK